MSTIAEEEGVTGGFRVIEKPEKAFTCFFTTTVP